MIDDLVDWADLLARSLTWWCGTNSVRWWMTRDEPTLAERRIAAALREAYEAGRTR